jgi:acetyl esterase
VEARRVLVEAHSGDVFHVPADVEDHTIPCGPRGELSIRIVRPEGAREPLPAIMYFHGGGWVLGDKHTHDRLVREIARSTGAAVVFVNYVRAPESPIPTALEECYAATAWVAAQGAMLRVDSQRIAVAGDSAGGNMAAVVAQLVAQRNGPQLAFQALFYPVTDARWDTASYELFAEGHFLTRQAMQWFWDQYAPDGAQRASPLASPLRAAVGQLHGLPPAFVATAEYDVLRDEGEAYAKKLAAAGVRVTAVRYLGTIHDFMMLNAITETPAPRAAIAQACQMLRQALWA